MGHLECNERLVLWLQPLQGSVQDHFPAIQAKSGFYTMITLSAEREVLYWIECLWICCHCPQKGTE